MNIVNFRRSEPSGTKPRGTVQIVHFLSGKSNRRPLPSLRTFANIQADRGRAVTTRAALRWAKRGGVEDPAAGGARGGGDRRGGRARRRRVRQFRPLQCRGGQAALGLHRMANSRNDDPFGAPPRRRGIAAPARVTPGAGRRAAFALYEHIALRATARPRCARAMGRRDGAAAALFARRDLELDSRRIVLDRERTGSR